MADSSVLLEVIVEGKNIKVVQRDVDKLAASVNKAAGAEEKSSEGKKKSKKSTDDLNDSNKNYNKGQKGVAGATSNSTKAFSKQRDLIGGGSSGLVGAYATLAANIFAATALFGALKRASQVDQLTQGLATLGAASGLAMMNLSEGLRDATGNAISLEQSMRSVATITSAGLDPSSINAFGTAAANASKALGRGLEDTLDRITRGVTKLEPELLDEIGVFVRLDEVTKEYAESIGKTANQLSNFEKRIAFQGAVLGQLDKKFGAIADTVAANPYDELSATFADLTKEVLSLVNAITPLLSILASSPSLLLGTITLLGGKVITSAIGSFDLFTKGISKAEKSATKLNGKLSRSIIGLNKKQKSLQDTARQIRNGTLRTKGFTKALDNQAKSQRINLTNLNKGIISQELYNKRIKNSSTIIKQLNISESANLRLRAQRAVQLAIIQLQEGNFKKALLRLRIGFSLLSKSTLMSRVSLLSWAGAVNVARAAALGFALSVKAIGVAIATWLPYIGLAVVAFALLKEAYLAVVDYFKTDEQKAYEKQLKKTNEVIQELSASFEEINKATEGSSLLIQTTTDRYKALSNALRQTKHEFEQLALSKGNTSEKVDVADTLIAKSYALTKALKEQYGVSTLGELSNKSDKQKLNIFSRLQAETLASSDLIVSLASSATDLNTVMQTFNNAVKISTPFDEAASSARLLSDQVNAAFEGAGSSLDTFEVLLENLDNSNISLFNPDNFAQFKKGTQLGKLLLKQKEEIEKADKAAMVINARGEKMSLVTAANGEKVLKSAEEIAEAISDNVFNQENLVEKVQKEVKGRADALEAARAATASGKLKISQAQAELNLLKEYNNNSKSGVQAIIAKENEIIDAKLAVNEAMKTELQGRIVLGMAAQDEADITAQINKLIAEANLLLEQKIDKLEEAVRIEEGAITLLKEQQKYEKFSLNIQKQQLKLANDLADSKARLLNSSRELDRATTGTGLTSADRAEQAEATAKRIEAAAVEELRLTIIGINMEYDLLDAKYALIEAELDLAIASGKLTAMGELQARVALERVKKINLEGQRKLAIEVAGQESLEKSTIARNKATIARIKAEDEAAKMAIDQLRNRADFYESLGDMATATAMRELALTQERAILERQIQAGKTAGLDVSAVEFDRLKKMQEFIAAQKGVVGAASQGATTADRVKSFQGAGGFGAIDKAAEGQQKILTERKTEILSAGPPSSAQQEELDGIGVALERIPLEASRAKIAAMREQLSPMLEELKQLGPQGAVAAAVGEGSFMLQDSLTVLGTTASTNAEKMAAVGQAVSAVAGMMNAASASKIASIDAEIAAEKKRDGKSAASLAKIKGMEAKKEKMARKAFEVNKKMQMAQIAISTATAVMQAMANPMDPTKIWAAMIIPGILALGAAQLAIVAGTSFQGGGSGGGGSMPASISAGERSNSVDVSQKASGSELAGLRGGNTANIGGMPPTPAFMGSKYRAAGGPTAGYVVGEQGPELFVPETSGRVVPNDEMRNSQPLNVNFTIQAIDSSNFTDALTTQRGNIIGMIREAANTYGETFLESVNDTAITTGNGKI